MTLVCDRNGVCTEVPDEPSTPQTTAPSNTTPSSNASANHPTGGGTTDYGDVATTNNNATSTAASLPTPGTPSNQLEIPNYNMNIFIGITIIVAALGIGYIIGRR